MSVTEYKLALGGSIQSLSDEVAGMDGYAPIGNIAIRGGQSIQAVGLGTYDLGAVENYQILAGATPRELEDKVNDLLSADLQPVGGVIPRDNTLLQVMGKVVVPESGADVTWANLPGKPATFAPTIGTTATTALAGNTTIPVVPATLPPTALSVTNASVAAAAAIALTKLANVAAITTDGGTVIPAGTLQSTLQAIADLADPSGA